MIYRNFVKRLLDFFLASIAFIILLPLFLIIMVVLAIVNDGKPFFFQSRPGKKEKAFNVIKFKTMNDRKDLKGNLLPDVIRLTALGKFLRKTSLDEIPQLINVIKGDMSLVGPRPLLFKYIPLYNPTQKRRHEVRPGITGWAQINGRNSISWTEKFTHDVYYVDHLSFKLDLKILLLTISKVIKREGINQSEERPMMPFDGSN
jgi:undecaprenyl phosphate N,N'-diacetylbacillosamine 1-phosphate transferase